MQRVLENAKRLWKTYEWELIIFCIVVAVALLSFGLGYTMAKEGARTPIIIEKNSAE